MANDDKHGFKSAYENLSKDEQEKIWIILWHQAKCLLGKKCKSLLKDENNATELALDYVERAINKAKKTNKASRWNSIEDFCKHTYVAMKHLMIDDLRRLIQEDNPQERTKSPVIPEHWVMPDNLSETEVEQIGIVDLDPPDPLIKHILTAVGKVFPSDLIIRDILECCRVDEDAIKLEREGTIKSSPGKKLRWEAKHISEQTGYPIDLVNNALQRLKPARNSGIAKLKAIYDLYTDYVNGKNIPLDDLNNAIFQMHEDIKEK